MNEITPNGTLSYQKGNITQKTLTVSGKTFDITGTSYVEGSQSIPTSATAIEVGNLATLGWFFLKNLDTTNSITILTAPGGTAFLSIEAGEFAMGRFAPTVTAPAALSVGAACLLEFLILEI